MSMINIVKLLFITVRKFVILSSMYNSRNTVRSGHAPFPWRAIILRTFQDGPSRFLIHCIVYRPFIRYR